MCTLRKWSRRAREEENKWQIGGKSKSLAFFPSRLLSSGATCSANYSFRDPEENPIVEKQSLSLIRERNEVLLNVIGHSCCQIVGQLHIRTFIDNMWIGTRTRWLLPVDWLLLGLACLKMFEYMEWLTARGSLLAISMCE